jgi:hypothetical protein
MMGAQERLEARLQALSLGGRRAALLADMLLSVIARHAPENERRIDLLKCTCAALNDVRDIQLSLVENVEFWTEAARRLSEGGGAAAGIRPDELRDAFELYCHRRNPGEAYKHFASEDWYDADDLFFHETMEFLENVQRTLAAVRATPSIETKPDIADALASIRFANETPGDGLALVIVGNPALRMELTLDGQPFYRLDGKIWEIQRCSLAFSELGKLVYEFNERISPSVNAFLGIEAQGDTFAATWKGRKVDIAARKITMDAPLAA